MPLSSAGAFDVFESRDIAVAVGDVIRITRNRRAQPGQSRLVNGSSYIVHAIGKDGSLNLGGGKIAESDRVAICRFGLCGDGFCLARGDG